MSTVAEPDAEEVAEPVHLTVSIPEDPSLGDAEVLPPPLSAEETRALRDAFSWEAMTPLRETDREGRPILEYALVYVTSREAHQALAQLDLHHSYLPLFESERARYDGMSGIFTHEGDGRGVFAFAFLPAAFINGERALALAGEPAFDAILVREVPEAAARGRDGGVSYDWLRSEHFLYDGRAYVPPESTGNSDVGGARAALLGGMVNRLARAAANLAEGAVEAVRRAIGAFDRWWNGSARIQVSVMPLNTDPSFVAGSIMLQGWGTNRGRLLRIGGQPVHVSQGVSLFVADTNASGIASMLVVKGHRATVCVESEAPAAYVSRFFVPVSLCGDVKTPRVTPGMYVDLRIRATEMNVLAQLDDARDYVRAVHGYSVHQPMVAIGGPADALGAFNGGRAFAPCFDRPLIPPIDLLAPLTDAIAFNIDAAGGLPPGTASTIVEFLLAYDILIPTTNSDRSRGVPTHEYGHFVMCDMLYDDGAYLSAWVPMLLEFAQGREDTASQLNEAFADFIASQVVGGVNYFQTSGGFLPSGNTDSFGQQWYCDPASSLCVEDNIGGPVAGAAFPLGQVATNAEIVAGSGGDPLFIRRTARMMTTIADVFDGQASGDDVPGNGAAWTFVAPNFVAPVHDSPTLPDEIITLGAAPGYRGHGAGLREIVRAFTDTHGGRLDRQFFRGMSRVMRSVGYTDTEICQLYALHEPTGACPDDFFDTPPDIAPRAPFGLTHVLTAPNDAVWSWRDDSPLPGVRFDYQVVLESTGSLLEESTLPYGTAHTFGRSLLPHYDTPVVFRVRTVSPSLRESAWTEDRLWTLAEPARNLRATGTYPGGVPLAWDAVQATSYSVVVTDARGRHEVATGLASPSYVLDLLDGGTVTVEIVSHNHEGVPSAPCAPLTLTRPAAPIFHVAPPPLGDDTADGSAATPVATIEAALVLAASVGVATIRIASVPPYTYTPAALEVPPGVVVRLEGGYRATDWVRTDKLAVVVSSTAVLTASLVTGCGAAVAVPNGEWAAGVRVGPGARLHLDQIALTVVPADARCTAAVVLESAGLELRASEVVVRAGPGDECAVGVLGARATPERPTLAARERSRITGATAMDLSNPRVHVAAVCLHNAGSVVLEDTTLTGTVAPGSSTLLRAQAASGLVLSQSYTVDIVRSTIDSVAQGPLGTEGTQTGVLLLRMLGSARLTNSVVRTTRGSGSNAAISAHGLGGTGSVSLFYVTALAGDDYDRTAPLPPDHRSAPIALSGALGSVRILNSVLANGAGLGVSELQTVIAGIDRGMDRMTADPRTFELRGTAVSFPFRDFYESEALTFCEADAARFARNIYNESDLNYAGFHRCYPVVVGGSAYTAAGNLAFNVVPDEAPAVGRPAIRFSWDGRPLPTPPLVPGGAWGTIAIDALRGAGVELSAEPVAVPETLTLDLGGVTRVVAPPGAGAWVLPLPVTP